MSGYLKFKETGIEKLDDVLVAIKMAGDAYHHTSGWLDSMYLNDESGKSYIENINDKVLELKDYILNIEVKNDSN